MLPPVTKFELNRMLHARAQELDLPGSPAGQNGHTQLSMAARNLFPVTSLSLLNVDQMKQLYDFLDANRRLPRRGELQGSTPQG